MDIKTKKLKFLPYWLAGLFLVCLAQVGAAYFIDKKTEQIPTSETPGAEVLGQTTDLRGSWPVVEIKQLAKIAEPDLKGISAESFLVFDLASGEDLVSEQADKKLYIASLTKLLTGLVAYENLDLNRDLEISFADKINISPILNLAVGDKLKALDVFSAMVVGSTNDAALTLANHTQSATGKTFTALMNEKAAALGMKNSNFSNPIGFDSQYNYSTAEDVKKLISATENFAVFKNLGHRKFYTFSGELGYTYTAQATNTLIENYPDLSAIKTGYTKGAGGAMATKLDYEGHEIVILVLDSKDRETDTLKLRKQILTNFK